MSSINQNNLAMTLQWKKKNKIKFKDLRRVFGWFGCKLCHHEWTSAYTYNIKDTKKTYFRQQCLNCQESVFPYKTQKLMAPDNDDFKTFKKDAHHREDLCDACGARMCIYKRKKEM